MKITIYELLGMIKDGNIPQKIMFKDNIFEYIEEEKEYYYEVESIWLFDDYMLFTILNDEVEILDNIENNKQDKKIEKVNTYVLCDYDFIHLDPDNNYIATNIIDKAFEEYSHKINEIIDRLNNL